MKKPKIVRTTFTAYNVDKPVGEGGSGIVYEAHTENEDHVAIKILDPKKATTEKLKRFKNEYRFCSNNKHPNIISVIDHGLTNDDVPFFVMPLYENSLRHFVGKLQPHVALNMFKFILDGVEAAHKMGVFHRDLKPENILVNGDDELVIADFGIARFEEEELFTAVETKDGTRLANFQYAAPEQRARGAEVDLRCDIYSLGLILNELFTSQLALGTNFKTIATVTEQYPYLDGLVDKMLQQAPESRFGSVKDIKKELIARGEEHVSMQKVSELQETVIPTSEIDDPIVIEPMKIVNVDWDNGILSIELNHTPNPDWIWALRNIGSYQSVMDKGPERFEFRGNRAQIAADSGVVQRIVDHFNEWLPRANATYTKKLKDNQEAAEREEREELQRRVQQEKERAEVLRKVRY